MSQLNYKFADILRGFEMPTNTNNKNELKNIDDNIFRSYREIVDHAHQQISYVRTAYKWLISLVAILIIVGLYFTYTSISDFKNELKIEGSNIQSELTNQINLLEIKLTKSLSDNIKSLNKSVALRIDEEFKKETIEALIIQQSKLRVDEIAKPFITKTITNTIDPLIKDLQNKVNKLEEESQLNIVKLNNINDFTMTVLAAQNDDRLAFDKIQSWRINKEYEFQKLAQNAWIQTIEDHNPAGYKSGYKANWPDNVDPSKLTLKQISEHFKKQNKINQLGVILYINKRSDIPKKDKIVFFVEVLNTNTSLIVVEYAGRFIVKLGNIKFVPLAIQQITDWWEENKDSIN